MEPGLPCCALRLSSDGSVLSHLSTAFQFSSTEKEPWATEVAAVLVEVTKMPPEPDLPWPGLHILNSILSLARQVGSEWYQALGSQREAGVSSGSLSKSTTLLSTSGWGGTQAEWF